MHVDLHFLIQMQAAPVAVEHPSQFKNIFCNISLSPAVKPAGLFIFIPWQQK
jgi:hypothetical protein